MELLQKVLGAMKNTPAADSKYMAEEIANMNLMWGEWLGSDGALDYCWYKSKEEKKKIFTEWVERYLADRYPESVSEIKIQDTIKSL